MGSGPGLLGEAPQIFKAFFYLGDGLVVLENHIAVFRKVTGTTPQAMGLRLRLEHAASLLDGTDLGIDEISEACGFTDRFHFSKAFARRWRVPPAKWRRGRERNAPSSPV